jgi:hypothetical protein
MPSKVKTELVCEINYCAASVNSWFSLYLEENLQTGDSNGSSPRFAIVIASAIVAKGAERALPTIVRRSSEMPNVDSQKIAERT